MTDHSELIAKMVKMKADKFRLNIFSVPGRTIRETIAELLHMIEAAGGVVIDTTPTHRHYKRGTTYHRVGFATIQTDKPLPDMAEVILYVGEDSKWWARPPKEFDDGRFEVLPKVPT